MSKFNDLFKGFIKPLLEAEEETDAGAEAGPDAGGSIEDDVQKAKQVFESLVPTLEEMGFTDVFVRDFGSDDEDLVSNIKGVEMPFKYKQGEFEVPLTFFAYVGDYLDEEVSLGYSVSKESLMNDKSVFQVVKKFLPDSIGHFLFSSKPRESETNRLVQRPLIRVLKSSMPDPSLTDEEQEVRKNEQLVSLDELGGASFEELDNNVLAVANFIKTNLDKAYEGIKSIFSQKKSVGKEDEDDLETMGDEEMDAYAVAKAGEEDIDTPPPGEFK